MFDEDNGNNRVGNIGIVRGAPTGMLAWLVKSKIVKNAKQGEYLLLGIAVVVIISAIAIFFFFGTTHPQPTKTELGPNGMTIIAPQSAH